MIDIVVDEQIEVDVESVMYAIEKETDYEHISTMIWFCCHFDCTRRIDFFVRLLIEKDSETYMEVMEVFERMQGPITLPLKREALDKLTEYYKQLEEPHFKRYYIQEAIALVERLPV